ncbi:hypothetical protein G4X40_14095 [Rhodococcus sp. D2-41]|uniref:putative T7SS-secreted protein n=1 Tax=Speluncibacter jeojiensis TaxID=2710754 RepID=UPI00240EC6A4|nr:hypothetical protein [Rhodococcus sp. D2-41]MDG3011283.1 hypothetical protein [Rhodococcus sp. D2-41]
MSWFGDAANAVRSAVEGAVDKVDDLGREMGLGSLTSPVADLVDSKIDALRDDLDSMGSAKYPALGFDPAPGSVGAIEALSQQLSGAAGKLVDAGRDINRVGQSGSIWQGQGADGFHDKVGELSPLLDRANQALGNAAHLLGTWSSDLSSMQTTAAGYERQAEAARRNFDTAKANPDLHLANQVLARDEIPAAQARLDAAVSKVMRAKQELDDIIEQAKRLQRQHRDLAEDIAKALRQASEDAPAESVWNHLGDGLDVIGNELEKAGIGAWHFTQANCHIIGNVADVFGDVSAVLGLVGAGLDIYGLPELGAPIGIASGAASATALVGHSLARTAGDNSVTDETLFFDGVGAATLGLGKFPKLTQDAAQGIGDTLGINLPAIPFLQKYVGDDQSTTTLFDDLNNYWVPHDQTATALEFVSAVPGINLILPGINSAPGLPTAIYQAVQQGWKEDHGN